MGPPAWKQNPQAARGGLVAGVLRDGDWNIALKWLGDNKIPNNPDETTYDPDALNWVNATDYIDAAQKYVSGFCTDLKNVKTGAEGEALRQRRRHLDAGRRDRRAEEGRPGLDRVDQGVPLADAERDHRQSRSGWRRTARSSTGMLAAIFEGGDAVKRSDDALQAGGGDQRARLQREGRRLLVQVLSRRRRRPTRQGVAGRARRLVGEQPRRQPADLFGLAPGSTNLFAATYTVFGNIVKSQYPNLVPSFYPGDADPRHFLRRRRSPPERQGRGSRTCRQFTGAREGQAAWSAAARGTFSSPPAATSSRREASDELKQLFNDLVVAGGTLVEIHGHTDNQGTRRRTTRSCRRSRAFAVKTWLEQQSPTNFPDGRVRVFAHGMTEPVAPNTTRRRARQEPPRRDRARHRRMTARRADASLATLVPAQPRRRSVDDGARRSSCCGRPGALARVGGLAVRDACRRPREVWRALGDLWWHEGMGPELFVDAQAHLARARCSPSSSRWRSRTRR